MYARPLGTGMIGTGVALPVTGFYLGSGLIVALLMLIAGGVLIRISYLKRAATGDQ